MEKTDMDMDTDTDTDINMNATLRRLHEGTGFGQLGPVSAKLEIFFGLFAAALGVVFAAASIPGPTFRDSCLWGAACVALMVLGGFLAMAGHRSHLYQSQNRLTAYLAQLIAERDAARDTDGEQPQR